MIVDRIAENAMTRESYGMSALCQDMPMNRICGTVKLCRSSFEGLFPGYDWKSVGVMRGKMAHPYSGFGYAFVWDAAQVGLPELTRLCEKMLEP